MRRIPQLLQALLTAALVLGILGLFALPALGASAGDDPIVQSFLTPSPNPSPSIYVPIHPDERAPEAPAVPAPLPRLVATKEPPSLEGRLAGIDVSHWQGKIRWNQVANDGISFAVTKATEGVGFTDDRYLENRREAKAAGIKFTAYDFASPTPRASDAQRDADHFLKVARLGPGDLVPVLDLETTGGTNKDQLARWVRAWCQRVYQRLGVRPMIYVSPAFWMGPMRDTLEHAELGHSLWIAHWRVVEPWVPANGWGTDGWTVWQWSNKGTVAGISGPVDMNVYNGTDLTPLTIAAARASASPRVPEPTSTPAPQHTSAIDVPATTPQQEAREIPSLDLRALLHHILR